MRMNKCKSTSKEMSNSISLHKNNDTWNNSVVMLFYVWQWQLINIIYYNNNCTCEMRWNENCTFCIRVYLMSHRKMMRCNQHKNVHHLIFFPAYSFMHFKRVSHMYTHYYNVGLMKEWVSECVWLWGQIN